MQVSQTTVSGPAYAPIGRGGPSEVARLRPRKMARIRNISSTGGTAVGAVVVTVFEKIVCKSLIAILVRDFVQLRSAASDHDCCSVRQMRRHESRRTDLVPRMRIPAGQ